MANFATPFRFHKQTKGPAPSAVPAPAGGRGGRTCMSVIARYLALTCASDLRGLPAAAEAAQQPYLVWHLTDVHVDPWYEVGSDATHCYCETAGCSTAGRSGRC